jgi:acyl carrier protein
MKKTLLEIINEIRIENNFSELDSINDTDDLMSDFNFDSLRLAQLTVMIEDEYGIDIFENKVIRKVYEIKELLK